MPHVELPQAEFKVVLLGDTNTGKTSLVLRFVEGYYRSAGRSSTIGAFFLTKRLTVAHRTCKMLLWDTAGQEQFQKLAVTYYRNAAAAILTYDVSNPHSVLRMRHWLKEVQENTAGRRIVLAIAACKSDLEAVPGLELEAEELAESVGAIYIKSSAKENIGVAELFSQVAERVLDWQRDAANGNGAPIPVTVGGIVSNRSMQVKSPESASGRTNKSSLATATVTSQDANHSNFNMQPNQQMQMKTPERSASPVNTESSTENEGDEVREAKTMPKVMCEGGLLACGAEDPSKCCIL